MAGPSGENTLRVCYVLDFLPTYVAREVSALSSMGVEPEVHLPAGDSSCGLWEKVLLGDPDIRSIPVQRDVRKDWCSLGTSTLLRRSFPSVLRMLTARPIMFARLAMNALHHRTLKYFLAGTELACSIRGKGIHLVHSHFALDGAHIACYLSRLLGVPFTITTHAADIFTPLKPERTGELLRAADLVLTISDFNRRYLADRYGEELLDRTSVSLLGIDVSGLPNWRPSGEVPSIVCTASGLVPKKGVDTLLEACSILQDKGLSFTCSILGGDPEGTRLEFYRRMSREMGLSETVTFTGLTTSTETLSAVSGCSLFVLPSVTAPNGDMDGIPVSLMESMGIGVPSISTRLSGIPELIEDGVTGLLVEPGDARQLASAMARLLSDEVTAARLGSSGREKVTALFSVDRHSAELAAIWRGLTGRVR